MPYITDKGYNFSNNTKSSSIIHRELGSMNLLHLSEDHHNVFMYGLKYYTFFAGNAWELCVAFVETQMSCDSGCQIPLLRLPVPAIAFGFVRVVGQVPADTRGHIDKATVQL